MRQIMLLLAAASGSGQSANASLTFEVASVRIAGEAATSQGALKKRTGPSGGANPLRFSRRGVALDRLLTMAYGIPHRSQLIGPEWLSSNAYDIEALAPEGSTTEQQLVMLQNLLIERFAIKMLRESRELPAYELLIAKGGSKLKPADLYNPLAPFQLERPLPAAPSRNGSTTGLSEEGTMEAFAARLSRYVDRPVLDRTELKGEYQVTLRWSPGGRRRLLQ